MPELWIKSSYSCDSANCVEWRRPSRPDSGVDVRDSKDPTGPTLHFNAPNWRGFVGWLRA